MPSTEPAPGATGAPPDPPGHPLGVPRTPPDPPGHPLGVPRTPPDPPGHPLGVPRTPPAGTATAARLAAYRWGLALVGVTAVWGATFVMVRDAVAAIPPFTFIAYRLGGAVRRLRFPDGRPAVHHRLQRRLHHRPGGGPDTTAGRRAASRAARARTGAGGGARLRRAGAAVAPAPGGAARRRPCARLRGRLRRPHPAARPLRPALLQLPARGGAARHRRRAGAGLVRRDRGPGRPGRRAGLARPGRHRRARLGRRLPGPDARPARGLPHQDRGDPDHGAGLRRPVRLPAGWRAAGGTRLGRVAELGRPPSVPSRADDAFE